MASDNSSEKCTHCQSSYGFIKRKKNCQICQQYFCSNCAPRIRIADQSYRHCMICQEISNSLTPYEQLLNIKVKHLKCYLKAKNIDYSSCKEKNDLIELIRRNQYAPFQYELRSRQNLPSSNSDDTFSALKKPLSNLAANVQSLFTNATETLNATMNELPPTTTRPDINQRRNSRPTSLQRPMPPPPPPPPENNRRPRTPPPSQTSTVSSEPQNSNQTQTTNPNASSSETNRPRRKSLSEISSEEQIDSLTSRELKEILVRNFVDYTGCVEKLELLEKVKRLYRDRENERMKMNAQQNSEQTISNDNDLCKICLDAIADCVFLNCGHMVTCVHCGKLLAECPICRANIVRVVRVFKS